MDIKEMCLIIVENYYHGLSEYKYRAMIQYVFPTLSQVHVSGLVTDRNNRFQTFEVISFMYKPEHVF